jgi:CheY-like chemotaxis protein
MSTFPYRILVVDDDEHVRCCSEALLSHRGYVVRTAGDGIEALKVMRKALPDLIISDLNMPNMSGFEFLSLVRQRFPQIPLIAVSGEYPSEAALEALSADRLIHKGECDPRRFLKEVESFLAKPYIPKSRVRPDVARIRASSRSLVTCPSCKQSLSASVGDGGGDSHELRCVRCNSPVGFIVESKHRNVNVAHRFAGFYGGAEN